MSKPEWMPFYVRKFAASSTVARMTVEGIGAYILLLCVAWHEEPAGTLPDDDKALAVFSRMKPARWSKVREEVMRAFVKGDDGRWYQKTMVGEAEKASRKLAAASAAGKASANARSTAVQRPLNDRATARVVVGVDLSSEEEKSKTTPTPTASVERPLNDRSPGTVELTPAQIAMFNQLAARPSWVPEGSAWIDGVTARDLACLRTTTPALIAYAVKDARQKRAGLNNPAGHVVKALRNPDPGLMEALAAQEAA